MMIMMMMIIVIKKINSILFDRSSCQSLGYSLDLCKQMPTFKWKYIYKYIESTKIN